MPGRPDLVTLTPQGLYCPRGDFHIDPWRAVDRALITHAHSRPCAPRLAPLPCRGLGRRLPAPPARAGGRDRRPPFRPAPGVRRRGGLVPPCRPRAGLRPDPDRGGRRGLGDLGRLQARGRSQLRGASRSCRAMSSSPRRRSRCRSIAGTRPAVRSTSWSPGGTPTRPPGAPRCCSAMRSARRSGCWRSSPRGPSARCWCTARSRRSWTPIARPACALRADPAGRPAPARRRGFCRCAGHRAAVRLRLDLAAALWRLQHRLRLGLDAGARPAPLARLRSRLRHLRPRRLAGALGHHPGDRRAARARDPWLQRHARPLSARAGPRGGAAARPASRARPWRPANARIRILTRRMPRS